MNQLRKAQIIYSALLVSLCTCMFSCTNKATSRATVMRGTETSPVELILHLYSWEWDTPGQEKWLEIAKDIGFARIGTDFRLQNYNSQGQNWNFNLARVQEIKAHDFKFNLRLWADTKNADFLDEELLLKFGEELDTGLNIDSPKALGILNWFAEGARETGLLSRADSVALAWTSSNEIDHYGWKDQGASPETRALQQEHIYQALGNWSGQILNAHPVPTGGQRGSLWHVQYERLTYPLHPDEAALYLADVNQINDSSAQSWGFKDSFEALAFSSALAAGTGKKFITNEHDAMTTNIQPEAGDILRRAEILFRHGIHLQIIHWKYEQLVEFREVLKKTVGLAKTFPAQAPLPPPLDIKISTWSDFRPAIESWRKAGGSEKNPVPIRIMIQ